MLTRAQRQMQANIEGVFAFYDLPTTVPFLEATEQYEDRCRWWAGEIFLARFYRLVGQGAFRPWGLFQNHGVNAVASWRENVYRWSVQVILYPGGYIEADVDKVNPDFGVWPAIQHLWRDVFFGRKPSPWDIWRALTKRGIKVPLINGEKHES